MIWYLILSVLFSLGISLPIIEMYFSHIPGKKQCLIFVIAFILGMIFWPLLLVFIDGVIVWNTILRIKYDNETEEPSPIEDIINEEEK